MYVHYDNHLNQIAVLFGQDTEFFIVGFVVRKTTSTYNRHFVQWSMLQRTVLSIKSECYNEHRC
jgi:hypothetical protein